MKKFSIITINLNNVIGLKKTVDSVINQDFKCFEFIIIDGNSNDGSVEYIKEIIDPRTHYLIESDNGIYEAMNKGIKMSTGEYIIFLNSGDFFYDSFVLSKVIVEMIKNPNYDCYYGKENVIENGLSKVKDVIVNNRISFLLENSIPHQASFWNRKVFTEIGLYDTRFSIIGDFVFLYKAMVMGKRMLKIEIMVDSFDWGGMSNNAKYSYRRKRDLVLFREHYLYNLNDDLLEILSLKQNRYFQNKYDIKYIFKKLYNRFFKCL